MIDIHNHVLPAIDDGAEDEDASLKMLEMAAENGTTHIIATPHFIQGSFDNTAELVGKKCRELSVLAGNSNMDIKIFPGSEVFLVPEIPHLLEEGLICTLNNSSYLLIELPSMSIPGYTDEVIYQLKLKGYTPIIAHPERNREILRDPNILHDLISRGALSQINTTSINGVFGSRASDLALTFLKHNMVHFVASDAHTCRGRSPKLNRSYDLVVSEIGQHTAKTLFETNGLSVIENSQIFIDEPELIKNQKSFSFPFLNEIKSLFKRD